MTPPSGQPQVHFDPDLGHLSLTFADGPSLVSFLREAHGQGAFLVHLDTEPQPFATLAGSARVGAEDRLQFQVCVVQIFAEAHAFGVACQLLDWNEAAWLEVQRRCLAPAPEAPKEDETFGTSPIFRIKEMDLPQKMQLALKADRAERQLLCRETAPMVLQNLLSNPRLEAENVLAIVKSTFATSEIFQRVATDRRWMASAEIRTAVVRNPKTPSLIAQRLLETLPITELRDMAKMGSLREDLRQAALRVYMKLSGQR